ncbi:unnamed protein product [Rangifer tarandus platyrhynchus]|uniref:Uncharacterized protein n=2 Tax=Rangifer tarandus platyrhynchus TaxID=3082113 RepID=A0ACB0E957_RANTA|nr:unnamed protein product [Rangifer tarandus platyrhynchus]CAI9696973.1 unnamed protein product [Rangifer tarandus platyrhynchus]
MSDAPRRDAESLVLALNLITPFCLAESSQDVSLIAMWLKTRGKKGQVCGSSVVMHPSFSHTSPSAPRLEKMGLEERRSPRPAPSPHLDKHAPPAPPPAADRRPGGRDGQAAGAARQRLTSKRQRPPAGGGPNQARLLPPGLTALPGRPAPPPPSAPR